MRVLLRPALHVVCLLSALATVGLWARTHSVADTYMWPVARNPGQFDRVDSRYVETHPGRLVFREHTAEM